MSGFSTWDGGGGRRHPVPPTSPETAALASALQAKLAEVQADGGHPDAAHRLRAQIAAAKRRAGDGRVRPSAPLPLTVGSPHVPNRPMPPTPGMRRTLVTSQGDETVVGGD